MVRSSRLGANAWAEQKKKEIPGLKDPGGYAANVLGLGLVLTTTASTAWMRKRKTLKYFGI